MAKSHAGWASWMRGSVAVCAALLGCMMTGAVAQSSSGAKQASGKLRVFFMDVEGGQSTLFVSPTGSSLLVDTGWADHDGRDANRIVAAAHQARAERRRLQSIARDLSGRGRGGCRGDSGTRPASRPWKLRNQGNLNTIYHASGRE